MVNHILQNLSFTKALATFASCAGYPALGCLNQNFCQRHLAQLKVTLSV